MKKYWLLIGVIGLLLATMFLMVNCGTSDRPVAHNHAATSQTPATTTPVAAASDDVPAFFKTAPSRASLGPTLAPEKFTGPTRDAYRAAREIPVTLAQMPCYCHCDRGMGHKSLHSCFEDEHAAHCATCVNEALMALKLEKEEKLSAPQIRERIMAQFGQP